MNTFKLIVIVPKIYSNCISEYLNDVMYKYHKYEYTGIDKHTRLCDKTNVLLFYYTMNIVVAENKTTGTLVGVNSVRRFRQFTAEEMAKYFETYNYDLKENELSISKGISNQSFGVFYLPETYKKVVIPKCYFISLDDFVRDYNASDIPIINKGEVFEVKESYIQLLVDQLKQEPYPLDMDINKVCDHVRSQLVLFQYTNPDGKWTTWKPGGFFKDGLKNSEGKSWFAFRKSDVDLFYEEEASTAEKIWDFIVDGKQIVNVNNDKDAKFGKLFEKMFCKNFTKEELILNYKNKENFASIYGTLCPFAYIDKKGKWRESFDPYNYEATSKYTLKNKEYIDAFRKDIEESDSDDILVCISCEQ